MKNAYKLIKSNERRTRRRLHQVKGIHLLINAKSHGVNLYQDPSFVIRLMKWTYRGSPESLIKDHLLSKHLIQSIQPKLDK